MVKRIALPIACALCLCIAGCSWARKGLSARVVSAVLAPGRLGGPVSLLPAPGGPWAVFSDRETTSLALARVPDGPFPGSFPAPELLDKVDAGPPLSAQFGEHAAAAAGDSLAVLYTDREREDRTALKLAVRAAGQAEWRLDILEPEGRPVAVLALPDGRFGAAWAADGALLYRQPGSPDRVLRAGFQYVEGACPFDEGRGFTVFDGASAKLLWFRAGSAGLESGEIDGPGPVHAAALLAAARAGEPGLAVASYDPVSRRISLYEQQPGGSTTRTTVTLCDGTRCLSLVPWGRGWVFLYDEVRPLGGGRALSEVSILAPDGPRYRRKVLSSGVEPVEGAAAVAGQGWVTVAVLRGSLAVMRVTPPLPGGRR